MGNENINSSPGSGWILHCLKSKRTNKKLLQTCRYFDIAHTHKIINFKKMKDIISKEEKTYGSF